MTSNIRRVTLEMLDISVILANIITNIIWLISYQIPQNLFVIGINIGKNLKLWLNFGVKLNKAVHEATFLWKHKSIYKVKQNKATFLPWIGQMLAFVLPMHKNMTKYVVKTCAYFTNCNHKQNNKFCLQNFRL